MRTIYLLIGLPGSGKSTWAKALMKKEPGRWKRVNRDDLRKMFDDFLYKDGMFDREKFITKASDAIIREALKAGFDVIVDNTHLAGKARKEIHKLAEGFGDVTVIEKVFNVPLKKVLDQNSRRDRDACVPEDVILRMVKKHHVDKQGYFKGLKDKSIYHPPKGSSGSPDVRAQDESLPKAIVCDLDGTLALLNGRNPYDASTCENDLLNVPVANVVRNFAEKGYKILFVSGRSDEFRPQTEKFLEKHLSDLAPHSLAMRRRGDFRKDNIVKREIYNEIIKDWYFVEFVLDDRDQVVEMFRNDLDLTVFQVNYGDF